ncbi:MAG: 50S ribosomal protein L24 [Bdellovibrio sp. CG12_big_fil_rev_8_21_14_0_65_39_13]|nr:MAG: 50S ribosomal protein L24 [Bdellovibrio sp. CG22_combo_CG10-13_8_21_14_all_39_27]PIQ62645.1 MAG: 50S ribosomal protein L24 [Bdellovibrio sp. CG12_big_fil_rev_8_21_14_0_65_39_13]PIR37000.1 MAG: 50S ribosomal protein L24 [Bdellovibrio sp. CG11_big_fil_rev_8_21_14_0_20_39_38]PJB54609.1 MAG: 50S ribosomal protein L24 [Bdellovibrio sp. CG_4_9_14_3_um_filter_39_7]
MEKLRLNDEVVVLAGKDKGKTGKLVKVDHKNNKVIVAGVNVVKKALKPTQENPAGGIIDKESFIHISNVAVLSPKTKKATRVKIEKKDGKNIRVAVACGSKLDK